MLETKSYIEILETNIPNVSRNSQSKVTDSDWDWAKSKLGRENKFCNFKDIDIGDFILGFSR